MLIWINSIVISARSTKCCYKSVNNSLNFQLADDGLYADLWQKVLDGDPTLSLDLEKRCGYLYNSSHPLICVGDKTAVIGQLRKAAQGRRNWGLVPEEFFPTDLALALPEMTPFLSMFDNMWVICFNNHGYAWLQKNKIAAKTPYWTCHVFKANVAKFCALCAHVYLVRQ